MIWGYNKQIMTGLEGNWQIYLPLEIQDRLPKSFYWPMNSITLRPVIIPWDQSLFVLLCHYVNITQISFVQPSLNIESVY